MGLVAMLDLDSYEPTPCIVDILSLLLPFCQYLCQYLFVELEDFCLCGHADRHVTIPFNFQLASNHSYNVGDHFTHAGAPCGAFVVRLSLRPDFCSDYIIALCSEDALIWLNR